MPKKTPDIEVEIPPNSECPDGTTKCDRTVAKDAITRILGHSKVRWTTLVPPVTVRLTTEGGRIDEYSFPTEEWDCLSVFIEHLRHRLPMPDTSELSEIIKDIMENLSKQERVASEIERGIKILEQLELSREASMEAEALHSIVGLETRVRSRRGLEKIAFKDLRQERDPTVRADVQTARFALKVYKTLKTGKRIFLQSLSGEN